MNSKITYRGSNPAQFVDGDDSPREVGMFGDNPLYGHPGGLHGGQPVSHQLHRQEGGQEPHHDVTVAGGSSTAHVGVGVGA